MLQGRFTPGAHGSSEWCERHLLARIHRYTLKRLRREIEPVEPRDFVRFLFDWQHVGADARVSGPEALAGVLAQLEGYEAPAALWEAELLPARVQRLRQRLARRSVHRRPHAVDAAAAAAADGARQAAAAVAAHHADPAAAAAQRGAVDAAGAGAGRRRAACGSRAQRVSRTWLATTAPRSSTRSPTARACCATELEDALSELVARGRVHCDSYAGLRALLVPASKRAAAPARAGAARVAVRHRGRRTLGAGAAARSRADASAAPQAPQPRRIEHVARTLLRRYGVVCWRLLEREAAWLPPWRDLVRVYRRLEARGEIRGGRFIAGLSGEQFALPEAIALLRQVRRRPPDGALVCLAATDPANLLGTVLPGAKVPRVAGSRVLYRDGVPVATSVAGEIQMLVPLDADQESVARKALTLSTSVSGLPAWPLPSPRARALPHSD